ncbi:MAG: rhodanese-related sulfurtransferase [Ilumatobacteraceae bacterium]
MVLFYKFTPLADPEAIRLWQRALCERLDLNGRIIISKDGINGTVGGSLASIKKYVRVTKEFPAFKTIDFKWSDGIGDDFPRIEIRVRDEIVTFGVPDEIKVDENGVIGGGVHLKPAEVNQLVAERGDDVIFFDGRSAYEARIGRFKNAVIPDVETTPDFVAEIESGKYDHLKDKSVITYCTGGIRCEVLSVIMKNRGFKDVYQIEGGIVRYGEEFRDKGLWEGSLYVFDRRLKIEFSDDAKVLGTCNLCLAPTAQFHNCSNLACHKLTLVCGACEAASPTISCEDCREQD